MIQNSFQASSIPAQYKVNRGTTTTTKNFLDSHFTDNPFFFANDYKIPRHLRQRKSRRFRKRDPETTQQVQAGVRERIWTNQRGWGGGNEISAHNNYRVSHILIAWSQLPDSKR